MQNRLIGRRAFLGAASLLPLAASGALGAQDADADLVEAARREGKVILYGEIITPTQRAIKAGFEKKYPGITVDTLYLSGAPMMNRIMTEQSAGRSVADVLVLDALRLPALREKGFLARFVSSEAPHYDAKWQSDPAGYWIETHLYLVGVMYNKSAVPEANLPHTYDDLLKPEWAGGKIAMVTLVDNDLMFYFAAAMIRDRGEAAAFDWFRALAAQKPLVFGPGGIRVSQGVNTGEFALGLGFVAHVFTVGGGLDGAMGIAPVHPVYVPTGPGTAVLANAPNPNAARLFANYVNSQEVQEMISGYGYYSTYTGLQQAKPLLEMQLSDTPHPKDADAESLRAKLAQIFGQ